MKFIANFVMPIIGLTSLLMGCSEIIPGLHIRTESPGTHEFSIVSNSHEENGYQVVPAAPTPQYEVVPISPDVLKSVQTASLDNYDYSDALPAILPSDVPPEYVLGPGDVIMVTVWEHPELTSPSGGGSSDPTLQGRLVSADGTIFYPYVGTFKAAGMTTRQLRDYLRDHLKANIQNPQVDVRVVSFRASRIEVTGEVMRPGTISLDDTPKGILQALSLAGGLTPTASRRKLVLVRDGRSYDVDIAGLLSGNRLVSNPAIQAGDVIHVPDQSGDQVFVMGAVAQQQPVQMLQASMSVIQALTKAGGLDPTRSKQSGILIFRMRRGR